MESTQCKSKMSFKEDLLTSTKQIDVEGVLTETFELGYQGADLLTRPEALINQHGEVIHDVNCPCADSLINVQVECICRYEDVRLPYTTDDADMLFQLKLAFETVSKKFQAFRVPFRHIVHNEHKNQKIHSSDIVSKG